MGQDLAHHCLELLGALKRSCLGSFVVRVTDILHYGENVEALPYSVSHAGLGRRAGHLGPNEVVSLCVVGRLGTSLIRTSSLAPAAFGHVAPFMDAWCTWCILTPSQDPFLGRNRPSGNGDVQRSTVPAGGTDNALELHSHMAMSG